MPDSPHDRLDELTRLVREPRITSRELRTALAKLEDLATRPLMDDAVAPVIRAVKVRLRKKADELDW
jgi:hypothetical protein